MNPYLNGYANSYVPGVLAGFLSAFIIPVAIWSLFWMGIALWKAARNGSKVWFTVLLLVHTLGILDILYIFVFSRMGKKVSKKLTKK